MTMKNRIFASMVVARSGGDDLDGAVSARRRQRVPLAVIVSKTSPLNELSSAQLTRMFMGDMVDSGGGRLIPLNRATATEERAQFDRCVLGKSPDEMARYWIDRKIPGAIRRAKAVEPVDVYARVVAKLDGAIGYVRSAICGAT